MQMWRKSLKKSKVFKSAVKFFHGNGQELLGVKGPPTISKTIISLCNQVVLVKVNIPVHYHVKKI